MTAATKLEGISLARLKLVMPALSSKIQELAARLSSEGIFIRVVQGMRSVEEQDALYAQGRTTPGKIVTNCRGGFSYHNYGLAVDCVPSVGGFEMLYAPDWNANHPTWQRMTAVGKQLGLEAGALWRTFPDHPHFQLNGNFPIAAPDDKVRELFAAKGLAGVWQQVAWDSGLSLSMFGEDC